MSKRSVKEVKRTARDLAVGFVAMENGLWPWADGKPHIDDNGRPEIVKRELLESVGLTGHTNSYRYFEYPPSEDNYAAQTFWREVAIERQRVALGMKEAIANLRPDFTEMGEAFMKELWVRFKVAPQEFTIDQLARFGPAFIKVGLALDAAADRQSQATTKHAVHAMLEEMRERLAENPELFQQLVEATSRRLIAAAGEIVDVSAD